MAKGYSVRYSNNYYKNNYHDENEKWKMHSTAFWDSETGRTKLFPTIESAREYAKTRMANAEVQNPNERGYINYCTIYLGKEKIEVVNR